MRTAALVSEVRPRMPAGPWCSCRKAASSRTVAGGSYPIGSSFRRYLPLPRHPGRPPLQRPQLRQPGPVRQPRPLSRRVAVRPTGAAERVGHREAGNARRRGPAARPRHRHRLRRPPSTRRRCSSTTGWRDFHLAAILRLGENLERGRNGVVDDVIVNWGDDCLRLTLMPTSIPLLSCDRAQRPATGGAGLRTQGPGGRIAASGDWPHGSRLRRRQRPEPRSGDLRNQPALRRQQLRAVETVQEHTKIQMHLISAHFLSS